MMCLQKSTISAWRSLSDLNSTAVGCQECSQVSYKLLRCHTRSFEPHRSGILQTSLTPACC
jgi:hypothetical protein